MLTLTNDEFSALPEFLQNYASYINAIKGNSTSTICEYLLDLRTFFRYCVIIDKKMNLNDTPLDSIDISQLDNAYLGTITQSRIINFLMYIGQQRQNTPTTRTRKLSAIRSFFHYAYTKKGLIETNPAGDIDSPKKKSSLPKYLTVQEAVHLLETIKSDTESKSVVRDYAIIALFLNTGMRLSELVGLNLNSFDSELTFVRVLGKGNKERIIYLNKAAQNAIMDYLRIRLDPKFVRTSDTALFLSSREQRISNKTVQWIVYRYLKLAGYEAKGLSVHKLRHTAATLMYQSGKVDIRVLKDILGHEQLNTTQIYTHVVDKNIVAAVDSNPLADISFKRKIKSADE